MSLCEWFQMKWAAVLQSVLLGALGFCIAQAVDGMTSDDTPEPNIVAEWNQTIRRLGIEPVFPPEEDIFVGDVFAVISADRRPQNALGPDRSRLSLAIKVHSEPMMEMLADVYNGMPLFPATKKKPTEDGVAWEVDAKSEGIFMKAGTRGYLALAAFPGFSVKVDRGGSGGGGAQGGLFGWSHRATNSLELRIPFVETYGIPSLPATFMLDRLCAKELEKICSDEALRRQLENVTGRLDENLVDVELVFINRVYVARSIEQKRGSGLWQSIGAKYNSSSNDLVPPPNGSMTPVKIEQQPDGKPTAVMQQYYTAENSSELRQVFQRPLVFGYRAVKLRFPAKVAPLNNAPKPAKDAP